jgi:endonuclease/exonuclease/phosphatase family metal-dependent hydrolase
MDENQTNPFINYKIMTYNVNFAICGRHSKFDDYNSKTKEVLRAILESNADFVFLQETNSNFEHLFETYLQKDYPFQIFKDPEHWSAEGIGILSKHKIDVEFIKPGVDGSYFHGMIATFNDTQFINVHLRPPLKMGNGSMLDFDHLKVFFHEATIIHKKEIEYLMSFCDQENIVVLGDFNEDLSSWMKQKGFSNCLDQSSDRTTWYWPLFWGMRLWNSFDHIFYSKNFSCDFCKVGSEFIDVSDHVPVVGNLLKNISDK